MTVLLENFRSELFWDVDFQKLDPEQHASYIIERVAERGNLDEMRLVWKYYGPERIKKALLSARGLTIKTIYYFANMFDLPVESFSSYRQGPKDAIPV